MSTVSQAFLSLHTVVLTIALPLWILNRTSAPQALVSIILVATTIGSVLLQVRASSGTDTLAGAARAARRAGIALAGSCVVVSLATIIGPLMCAAVVTAPGPLGWLILAAAFVTAGLLASAASQYPNGACLAGARDRGRPVASSTNGAEVTPAAEALLRRAIELAATARESGNPPFGSLLVGPDGTVIAEDHNTSITDGDISAHPELKLAKWAARELDPEAAAGTTMYTSCQPYGMCTGAIERAGLGGVVYALSNEQLTGLKPSGGFAPVPLEGPALYDEARVPVEGYYT